MPEASNVYRIGLRSKNRARSGRMLILLADDHSGETENATIWKHTSNLWCDPFGVEMWCEGITINVQSLRDWLFIIYR